MCQRCRGWAVQPFTLCPKHFDASCSDLPGAQAVMASIVRHNPYITDTSGAAREVLICIRNIISRAGIETAADLEGASAGGTPHAREFGLQAAHAIRWWFINNHIASCDQSIAGAVITSRWFTPALAAALAQLYMEWAVSRNALSPAQKAAWANAAEDLDLSDCLEVLGPLLPLEQRPCNLFHNLPSAVANRPGG